ncbi:hypothetical protein U6G28_04415 [Actinomycetaceae bacterium MB13-C1-2]|nr:hypothetical protein U6G28_04415 [Actinomycetaceae bacterium MB13-C1-2]
MYSALFRLLPGPKWLKVIFAALIVLGVVFLLFEYVFPWANAYFFDSTVG